MVLSVARCGRCGVCVAAAVRPTVSIARGRGRSLILIFGVGTVASLSAALLKFVVGPFLCISGVGGAVFVGRSGCVFLKLIVGPTASSSRGGLFGGRLVPSGRWARGRRTGERRTGRATVVVLKKAPCSRDKGRSLGFFWWRILDWDFCCFGRRRFLDWHFCFGWRFRNCCLHGDFYFGNGSGRNNCVGGSGLGLLGIHTVWIKHECRFCCGVVDFKTLRTAASRGGL